MNHFYGTEVFRAGLSYECAAGLCTAASAEP